MDYFGVLAYTVKRKWKDLVDTFRKKDKSSTGGVSVEEQASHWRFYDKMSFIKMYVYATRYVIA